jgi:hypothetical protein
LNVNLSFAVSFELVHSYYLLIIIFEDLLNKAAEKSAHFLLILAIELI